MESMPFSLHGLSQAPTFLADPAQELVKCLWLGHGTGVVPGRLEAGVHRLAALHRAQHQCSGCRQGAQAQIHALQFHLLFVYVQKSRSSFMGVSQRMTSLW